MCLFLLRITAVRTACHPLLERFQSFWMFAIHSARELTITDLTDLGFLSYSCMVVSLALFVAAWTATRSTTGKDFTCLTALASELFDADRAEFCFFFLLYPEFFCLRLSTEEIRSSTPVIAVIPSKKPTLDFTFTLYERLLALWVVTESQPKR